MIACVALGRESVVAGDGKGDQHQLLAFELQNRNPEVSVTVNKHVRERRLAARASIATSAVRHTRASRPLEAAARLPNE